jgi:hypothetical protein
MTQPTKSKVYTLQDLQNAVNRDFQVKLQQLVGQEWEGKSATDVAINLFYCLAAHFPGQENLLFFSLMNAFAAAIGGPQDGTTPPLDPSPAPVEYKIN